MSSLPYSLCINLPVSLTEFEANYSRQKFNVWHVTDFLGTPLVMSPGLFSVTGESQ